MMQAGQYRDSLLIKNFVMKRVWKTAQQNAAEVIPAGGETVGRAGQVFAGCSDGTQELAAKPVGFRFVPFECADNLGLSRRLEQYLPTHRRMPSASAIWVSVRL